MSKLLAPLAVFATFAGAALLFLVEPMIGRMVLPLLGGAPAVWNTCMFFFQIVLLAGYAYAFALSKIRRPGMRALMHALVLGLSLAFLPLQLELAGPPAPDAPIGWLFRVLTSSVGVLFFALAATGPLVQQWLHAASPAKADPYPLYAWGNAGSLGALLAYPLLIEPSLPVSVQARAWSLGYVLFALVMVACSLVAAPLARPAPRTKPVVVAGRGMWVLLSFVPSALFLAVTHYMSTDVAVFPLIWALPLAVYLLTMVLAFSRRAIPLAVSSTGLAVAVTLVVASFWAFHRPYTWILFVLHPLALFFAGMVCHGRLYRSRPDPSRLSEFYLYVALGGALGGMFATLVAPALFTTIAEYPILLVVACLLRPRREETGGRRARGLDIALPLVVAASVPVTAAITRAGAIDSNTLLLVVQIGMPCAAVLCFHKRVLRFAAGIAVLVAAVQLQTRTSGQVLHARRDFFGIHKVIAAQGPGIRVVDAAGTPRTTGFAFHFLWDGTTMHGGQALEEPLRRQPTSYYAASGPLGELFDSVGDTSRFDRIAVVGLGAGTIAAYGRPGRSITFYEIDPEVARIARDERFFTYLRDGQGANEVVLGDGRALLARVPDASYGLIVLDAFASDAIPIHLMTQEAVALYFRKLAPDGMLAVHVTNQHLDLEPVFHEIALELALVGRSKFDEVESLRDFEQGKNRSHWVVLARDEALLRALTPEREWIHIPLTSRAGSDRRYLWTDDYSSVVRVLRIF